jgi:hypothetical protein
VIPELEASMIDFENDRAFISDRNAEGLYRVIRNERLLFQTISDLVSSRSGESSGLGKAERLMKEIVMIGDPSVGDLMERRFQFTDTEGWRRRKNEKLGVSTRHRVEVSTFVTLNGHLRATIDPGYVNSLGQWSRPSEWSVDRFPTETSFYNAGPANEVFFLNGVENNLGNHTVEHSGAAAEVDLFSRAVVVAYWLTMHRLEEVFELHFRSYLAGLSVSSSEASSGNTLVGMEIVDADEERRLAARARLDAFWEKTGCDPQDFRRACLTSDATRDYARASRRLRGRSHGTEDLTPSIVRGYDIFLDRAEKLGLWTQEVGD